MSERCLNILGTRGIPAAHGGFETFVHHLAPYLVERGWQVSVYCQDECGARADGEIDEWHGVRRIHFGTKRQGAIGTMEFDLKCARHVCGQPGIDLVLGYNTAVFNILQRLRGRRLLINMDGIEWRREKWRFHEKIWLFINELIAANVAHIPIADHPEIARHVSQRSVRRPVMIPYGSEPIHSADPARLETLGLSSDKYVISIARIEPENSILELVHATRALPYDMRAVFLGKLDPANAYHQAVQSAAHNACLFPGAIYDPEVVRALRFHARAYLHGHQVGGTNPSLVEALGAGNAVLAHDNRFNRWTAGEEQFFFSSVETAEVQLEEICANPQRVTCAQTAARNRHASAFTWDKILRDYEDLLERHIDR